MAKETTELRISYAGEKSNLPDEATIGKLFFHRANKYENKEFISFFLDNTLVVHSWKNFSGEVLSIMQVLKSKNIKKGDLVAVISDNSAGMLAEIIAIVSLGAICCPIHTALSIVQKFALIKEYNYKLILTSDIEYKLIKDSLEPDLQGQKLLSAETMALLIRESYTIKDSELKEILDNIHPDDIAYIMLSSGTTGVQKGVMLTHDNILSNQRQVQSIWNVIDSSDIYLSYLPLSHSYGGLFELYQVIYKGARYHFCSNSDINTIIKEAQIINPTVFYSVPSIWEKIYKIAREYQESQENPVYLVLGNKIKTGFSAGAAINDEIIHYFDIHKLPIYQGYGLTETSPTISISTPEQFLEHRVSKLIPNLNLRINSDFEILVEGPNVSRGYYQSEEDNEKSYDDGYLKTGDLGYVPYTGYLTLSGRKNDIIVLSSGEKIAPEVIENKLNEHSLISQSLILGNNKPYIAAIIFLEQDKCNIYNDEEIINKEVQEYINQINNNLANYEQIRKFIATAEELLPEEITPTRKLKRNNIRKNRKKLIEKLYY